ncbi:HAMP domain-containing histidine kinase [Patescibacteria group bacterium]|nr:HAMP domain-containing histidine kinase [Patescibacteria group bacterium]MBU4023110.1 HAMP domain-containing histidine kinase [Patescibacteria group bacterium]MBU4078354.1 HAMP domain-containing histidine kinase [Patescibacteria group bacterium]
MAFNLSQINIFAQCRKYKIPLWQCPQFLFTIMGLFIMVASVVFYAIGERYIFDPRMVALVVILVAMMLLVIAFIITHSFENLAEANRMKTEFVNIVSHQLRAPLTNLRWATQFLLSKEFQDSDQAEKTDYFDIIRENGNRMEGLIDDLLTITRLKDGKLDSKKASFVLEDLVKEVINEHKHFLEANNMKVEFSSPEDLPNVFASYPLTKIVLENLIGNAIHYSQGSKKIEIILKCQKDRVVFTIKDKGMGIPKEDQKYIFEKFFRARNAVYAEVNGTGLGLFIVKLILDGTNGKIWFVSQEGKGSIFNFSLPARS